MSGHVVYPGEYAILRAMDGAYCKAMNVEMDEHRKLQEQWRKTS
jgi:hypothetical protein